MNTDSSVQYTLLDGGIGHVLLNRPQRMNALGVSHKQALGRIWRDAAADPACRVLVLSGSGDKAFCAGSDIKEMQETGVMADTPTLMDAIPGIGIALDKPVIAALHGYTVGMGMTLAIHSDFRVASQDARFAFPEVKHGMLSGVSAVTLSGLVGEASALEIMLTAQPFDAARASELGLLHRVSTGTGPEAALECAMQLARQLLANSQAALEWTKRLVLAPRRENVMRHAALIERAREDITNSVEYHNVVTRQQGAGRME